MKMHIEEFYRCYDRNQRLIGQVFCKATEIRNKFPNAEYIKVIQKPWNYHIFKSIDEEIRDKEEYMKKF
jgi:hypothetical protein